MDRSNTFIINPAAGFGKTKKNLKALVKEIHAVDWKAKILLTHHSLHAISLAKTALQQGSQRLIVVGGDGTLNEVVNGYFDHDGKPHNPEASIAILPSGTGSDFIKSIDYQKDVRESIDFAINQKPRPTDVGLVEGRNANNQTIKRFFINVSSVGLSGLVAGFMRTVTKRFGSKSAYFIATVQAIRAFKVPTLRVIGEDMQLTLENCSLLSFANGKFFGSGMKVAPNAQLDDGKFDVISIQDLSAKFFLLNGYRIYQGTHLSLDNIHEYHQRECVVEALTNDPVYIETDGELFAELPARYSIRQKALLIVR